MKWKHLVFFSHLRHYTWSHGKRREKRR
jgi:hypothetical protein